MKNYLNYSHNKPYVGYTARSEALANILYTNTLDNFVYQTNASDNLVIDNKGSLGSANDLLLASGRGIELGATNTTLIPIHYTLGSEKVDSSFYNSVTKTSNVTVSDPRLSFAADAAPSYYYDTSPALVTGESYRVTLDIENYVSGSVVVSLGGTGIEGADDETSLISANGSYTYDIKVTQSTSNRPIVRDYSHEFIGDVVNLSIKKITNPNSFITYYDLVSKSHVFINNADNTPYTTITLNSATVNSILTHDTAFDTASQTALDANPNLLGKLGVSTGVYSIDELNVALTASDQYFMCSEKTLATLYDARGGLSATIANYASTVRTNADFQTAGIQTTAFTKDALNVPTAYDVTALNLDGGEGDTQWNPSLESSFWIEEIIDGVVYQHKYDGTNLTTYTNNVAGTPALHSPENADYLFGKGVYPKVAADPYIDHILKAPSVIVSGYSTYNQTSRYAILSAI